MAVPAKTVTEETSPYAVNRALFEESSSIKENMKLVESRLQKMEEHRADVSESVYFKVKTDYQTQLDGVRDAFQAKCTEIEGELRNLYQAQEEQENKMQGHQEVLEEARFRHKLGEYTDKKFKDVEATQGKEIKKFSEILDVIKLSIKQYEDILGGGFVPPPKSDVVRSPAPKAPAPAKPVEKPVAKAPEPEAPPPAEKKTELSEGPTTKNKMVEENTSRTATAPLEAPPPPPPAKAPAAESMPNIPEKAFEDRLSDDLDMFLQDEGDYFSSESGSPAVEEEIPVPPMMEAAPEPVAPSPPAGKGLDDSLSSILRDMPFDDEVSETASKPLGEDTGSRIDAGQFPEASLILIEGDLDENEFILADNTSIGRSPSNDIVLKETKVSRQHAAINLRGGSYVIVDLKSSNGLLVNGRKVEEAVLNDGDELTIGSFKFQFNLV